MFRVILYAIAMADYDQEDKEACKVVISTKEGIERLALYHSSVGRFILVLLSHSQPVLLVCTDEQHGNTSRVISLACIRMETIIVFFRKLK